GAPPRTACRAHLPRYRNFPEGPAGTKRAPRGRAAKPRGEKVAEPKPVDNAATKVTEKPEIITASAQMSDPAPKPPEPKPTPKVEAKPEAKPQEAEKKADAKPDPATEALKKDDGKKHEAKKEEAKVPVPKKPPPQPKPLD